MILSGKIVHKAILREIWFHQQLAHYCSLHKYLNRLAGIPKSGQWRKHGIPSSGESRLMDSLFVDRNWYNIS